MCAHAKGQRGNRLQHKRHPHYSNVLVLSSTGKALAAISQKRAAWYLRKNLAIKADPPKGYPAAVRLLFTHNQAVEPQEWEQNLTHNRCVICGGKEELTLHHVCPSAIRRHFPLEEKANRRLWCVLLCVRHHIEAEARLATVYQEQIPHPLGGDRKRNYTLQKIKAEGNLHRVPSETLAKLLAQSDYTTVVDIPPLDPKERRKINRMASQQHRARIAAWAEQFIQNHGGISGTKALFRTVFLELTPQFLPPGYLEVVTRAAA